MRTQTQIAASRANGQKSTGATTPEGKARIVAANLTSGIYAETEILPWEKAEAFEQLKAEYYAHHRAASPEARCLIDDLIDCEWTLRRLRHASHAILLQASQGPTRHIEANSYTNSELSLNRLQTRINATRLAFHRALKDLQRLEAAEVHDAPAEEVPSTDEAPETPSVTGTSETGLHDLGSLRKPPAEAECPIPNPAAAAPPISPCQNQ